MAARDVLKQTAEQLKDADSMIEDAEELIAFQRDAGIETSEAVRRVNDMKRKRDALKQALKKRNLEV